MYEFRLPLHFYFYELLQNSKEDYELRQNIKQVHAENKEYKPTFKEDLKSYSNEGLLNFEEKLSKEMNGIDIEDKQHDELLHTYNELYDELVCRGLVKFPF